MIIFPSYSLRSSCRTLFFASVHFYRKDIACILTVYSLILFMYQHLLLNCKFIRAWDHPVSMFIITWHLKKWPREQRELEAQGGLEMEQEGGITMWIWEPLIIRLSHRYCTPIGTITTPWSAGCSSPHALSSSSFPGQIQLVLVVSVPLLVLVTANTQHLLCLALLSALHVLNKFILKRNLIDRYCCYPHVIADKTKV